MLCFDVSLWIVAVFLLLTLLVAIYFSRKKTSFREYAVGSKQFSTATLVFTVLATLYGGGGLVRNVECVYSMGLSWMMLTWLSSLGLWVVSRLALRMGPFMHHPSVAETIGHIYGRYPSMIAVLVGICSAIFSITMQITVMSQAIGMCFQAANPYIVPILTTLLLIFYSTFGGIRAVTFTDVLQFITFAVVIPILAWFMFLTVDKPVFTLLPMLPQILV
ncbi:MAG: hypothetical protein V3581_02360 [Candidatus Cardinium sp.]